MSCESSSITEKDASDFLEWYEFIENTRKELSVIWKYYNIDERNNSNIHISNNYQQIKYQKKSTEPLNNKNSLSISNQNLSWNLTKSSTRNPKSKTLNVIDNTNKINEEEEDKELAWFEMSVIFYFVYSYKLEVYILLNIFCKHTYMLIANFK